MAKKIKAEHVDSILIDDDGSITGVKGKILIKIKEGKKLKDITEEYKVSELPDCKTADDCQKKYGDPPPGTQWFCIDGSCYCG